MKPSNTVENVLYKQWGADKDQKFTGSFWKLYFACTAETRQRFIRHFPGFPLNLDIHIMKGLGVI